MLADDPRYDERDLSVSVVAWPRERKALASAAVGCKYFPLDAMTSGYRGAFHLASRYTYPMQLILILLPCLLAWLQWYPPESPAVSSHQTPLAQNLIAGALPRAASYALAPQSSAAPAHEFPVFDATVFKQKPDLTHYGLKPVSMVYKPAIWLAGRDGAALPDKDLVSKVAVAASKSTGITVLDIEHWPLTGDSAVVQDSIGKFETLIRWYKAAAPSGKVGYYGVAPVRDYWDALQPMGSPKYVAWQAANDRVASIARLEDILFPSVYTFYEDQAGWAKYAVGQIQEARRIGGGKPVYVFLWMQYHSSNKKAAWTYLAPDYWRMELETARKYADGVVIWGGYSEAEVASKVVTVLRPWDDNAPWWLETKKFLQETTSSGK